MSRVMDMGDLGYRRCAYLPAYQSRCSTAAMSGSPFCAEHHTKRCASCGAQATRECSYEGQFVCGAPLCGECSGDIDSSRPAGAWGFANHVHVRIGTRLGSGHREMVEGDL